MRILVLADIHANLAALDAVLAAEKEWDEMIFLGDVVVGGPEPEACVTRLRECQPYAIQGNHDRQTLDPSYEISDPNPDRSWVAWTRSQLSPANRDWLASMAPSHAIDRDGLRIRLHHGDFPAPLGRFWPDWPDEKWQTLAEMFPEPWIMAAHSHVQFRQDRVGRVLINPGSVGQPRLGQPLAQYMVLEDGEPRFLAVPYDIEQTCRAMEQMPIPEDFRTMWQEIFRNGMLSSRYPMRDWKSLQDAGYR